MIEIPKEISRKMLLNLPVRKWDDVKTYKYLYTFSSGRKHESGYALIYIVGVDFIDGKTVAEIAACCDDICWTFPIKHPYGRDGILLPNILRMDCEYPSGIMRVWASGEHYFQGRFEVGMSISSTEVILKISPRGDGVNKVTGEVVR